MMKSSLLPDIRALVRNICRLSPLRRRPPPQLQTAQQPEQDKPRDAGTDVTAHTDSEACSAVQLQLLTLAEATSLKKADQQNIGDFNAMGVLSQVTFSSGQPDHDIGNALGLFASCCRSFTLAEVTQWLEPDCNRSSLQRCLHEDPRFVCLEREGPSGENDDRFIPERTLFRWWIRLTLRLAQLNQVCLSERQLANAMASLRDHGRWDEPPGKAIDFGRDFGFVSPTFIPGHYVFPIARFLSLLPTRSVSIASSLLESLVDIERRRSFLTKPIEESVHDGLRRSKVNEYRVVLAREGLGNSQKMTLEQVGGDMGVTRARVQQIEKKFWTKISVSSRISMSPFLAGLISDIMRKQGTLIVDAESPGASYILFSAKCLGVPSARIQNTRFIILGAYPKDVATLGLPSTFPDRVQTETICERMENTSGLGLSRSDIEAITKDITCYQKMRLTKAERVSFVLRQLGHPAHFSRIAQVHNELFPDRPSTEHNIHAALNREQHGVVWIGVRGTFALREWGYERPSQSLFDTVTQIVNNMYGSTGNPVPYSVIVAEIGKYRRVVKPASLLIAAHLNPRLRRVSKDIFLPREPDDQSQAEIAADELNRILREFEEKLTDTN